jgi:cob(I)alamin adenosyltransferase
MKLSGRVAFRDIETGVWVLEGDDGRTYQLSGGDRKIKKDGQRVEVEGKVDNDTVTIHMVGPVFSVASYKFL